MGNNIRRDNYNFSVIKIYDFMNSPKLYSEEDIFIINNSNRINDYPFQQSVLINVKNNAFVIDGKLYSHYWGKVGEFVNRINIVNVI